MPCPQSNYGFSREFLVFISLEKGLNEIQQAVLIGRFSEGKDYEQIARELGVTKGAATRRMTAVYKQFNIQGEHKGKEAELRKALAKIRKGGWSQSEENPFSVKAVDIHSQHTSTLEQLNLQSKEIQMLKTKFKILSESLGADSKLETTFDRKALEDPMTFLNETREKLSDSKMMNVEVITELCYALPKIIEIKTADSRSWTAADIAIELVEFLKNILERADIDAAQGLLQRIDERVSNDS